MLYALQIIYENNYEKNIKIILVGDGPLYNQLYSLTRELNLENNVIFKGSLSRNEVYAELMSMDIFIVSSRYEGFCNAMVEAAATGVAVVATNINPLPEVIGKDNALFFNVGNKYELAMKVQKLIDDVSMRKNIGMKASRFVRSKYSLANSANAHLQLYKKIINMS
jgi:glycosyltransferase involved in cell wall biosynthesis